VTCAVVALALTSLVLLPARGAAATTLVTFDGLDTFVRSYQCWFGTFSMGEEVSTQFRHLGAVFSVNEFAINYTWGEGLPGSTSPSLAVNTIDNATNRCPVGRFGNNGVLTAAFGDPYTGSATTVANVRVIVTDAEFNVGVRTLDANGGVLQECANVFAGCPFVSSTAPYTVALRFPGAGVASVQFIDADPTGFADGFIIDNLGYDLQFTVAIDIKPFSSPNVINAKSKGTTPVAILSTPVFDAPARIDPTSLRFGQTGDEPSLLSCASQVDVNADGLPDLVCEFTTRATGFRRGDTGGTLKGTTVEGIPFTGTDAVRVR
jgi:hypothetical protein